jgi:glycosyltransferase involved in cell wall biosynthesis
MCDYTIGVVTPCAANGELGGAERFYVGLVASLNTSETRAELVPVPVDESTFARMQASYLRCYETDLSRFDAVVSTKNPTYVVRHPNHVCYLVHTARVFYDMFDREFPRTDELLRSYRALVQRLDTGALRPPRTRRVFTIGQEVTQRLKSFNGISSEVLHPGPVMRPAACGSYDYLLMPGRLHRWKRVDLVINAMRLVPGPLRLKIAGTGEDEPAFRALAADDERIEFLGRVSDDELRQLYADALAVPFVPLREDYGYVTAEAFLHRKPVVTCNDSGEPARIVQHGVSGFVCPPRPRAIAESIGELVRQPNLAREMGAAGYESIQNITWENTAQRLIQALRH